MASAFAELLIEARDRLRAKYRKPVTLSFDWDGTDTPDAWKAWHNGDPKPVCAVGIAGEQALRNLVERLRAEDG